MQLPISKDKGRGGRKEKEFFNIKFGLCSFFGKIVYAYCSFLVASELSVVPISIARQ